MARANSTKPVPVPTSDLAISAEERGMMTFLSNFYSPGQLQIALWDYADGFPKDMSRKERQLRIRAIKLLGYKDTRKKQPIDDEE